MTRAPDDPRDERLPQFDGLPDHDPMEADTPQHWSFGCMPGTLRPPPESNRCEGCGEWVTLSDVTTYGGHEVRSWTHDGYPFASECGPVSLPGEAKRGPES